QYHRAYLSSQIPPLNANTFRRWWVRNAVASANTTDWTGTDSDALNTAFEGLQRVVLTDDGVPGEYGTAAVINNPGDAVHWIQQWVPQQTLTFYETGMDVIPKIRPIETGESFIFATSATNAKVFTFADNELTELVDLSDVDAADATDAAILDDKVYAV